MTLTAMYESMLRSGRPLPADVFTRAHEAATAAKATELIAALVSHPHCPADLVDQARTSRNLEVRAAYLSRGGPVDDTRRTALRAEKTQGCRERVAAAATTPAEILTWLSTDNSPAVAAAVAANRAASGPARRTALATVDAAFDGLIGSLRDSVKTKLENSPALPEPGPGETPVALTSPRLADLVWIRQFLPDADKNATVSTLIRTLAADPKRNTYTIWDRLRWLAASLPTDEQVELACAYPDDVDIVSVLDMSTLPEPVLKPAVHTCLAYIRQTQPPAATQAARWLAANAELLAGYGWGVDVLAELAVNPTADLPTKPHRVTLATAIAGSPARDRVAAASTSTAVFIRALTTTDPRETVRLAGYRFPNRPEAQRAASRDDELVDLLMANPVFTAEAAARLIADGGNRTTTLVERFPDDPSVLAAALVASEGVWQCDIVLRVRDRADRTCIGQAAARLTLPPGTTLPGDTSHNRDRRLINLEVFSHYGLLDDDAWALVDEAVATVQADRIIKGAADKFVAWRAGVLLGRLLDECPHTTDVFDAFAEDFRGTWGELLLTARLL